MIIDLPATNFGLAITRDFDDQSYALFTICLRLRLSYIPSCVVKDRADSEFMSAWRCRIVKTKLEGKYVVST
jgi:hypothetical protein